MAVNKKLGKGLSSLLGNKEIIQNKTSDNKGLLLIPIEKIFRDETQPRKEFDKEKIRELAQSIKKKWPNTTVNCYKKGLRHLFVSRRRKKMESRTSRRFNEFTITSFA